MLFRSLIDFVGKDNFFYHKKIGFQFIDLNAHFDYEYGLSDIEPQADQIVAWNCFIPCHYDTTPGYRDTVSKILPELTDKEWILLKKQNRIIFSKCKRAMIKNKIAEEMIREIIVDEKFIPQKQQLQLNMTY